jgi:hypothetical protein
MASNEKIKRVAPPRPPQRKIDAGDIVRSRQTWQPDWEGMEAEIERINRELKETRRKSA